MSMECPFCHSVLEKSEISLIENFSCPRCHHLLRARQNRIARVMAIAAVAGAAAAWVATGHSSRTHWIKETGGLIAVVLGTTEMLIRQQFPPRLEPAEGAEHNRPLG